MTKALSKEDFIRRFVSSNTEGYSLFPKNNGMNCCVRFDNRIVKEFTNEALKNMLYAYNVRLMKYSTDGFRKSGKPKFKTEFVYSF